MPDSHCKVVASIVCFIIFSFYFYGRECNFSHNQYLSTNIITIWGERGKKGILVLSTQRDQLEFSCVNSCISVEFSKDIFHCRELF